jgi:hypothetical protein
MTDRERKKSESMYGNSIYSHKKDKDPHNTGLARFDSREHDICVYIHRLQTFFSETGVVDDSEKASILFERIGENDKDRTQYGFSQNDFTDWTVTIGKIIQKYPPKSPQAYVDRLRTNTQRIMNIPAHDYLGYLKNMYSTYQMYTRATGSCLDKLNVNETEFVKQFIHNCREKEHLWLLQKINEGQIDGVQSLETVINENKSVFQTYQQFEKQSSGATTSFLNNSSSQQMNESEQKTKENTEFDQKIKSLEEANKQLATDISRVTRSVQALTSESERANRTTENLATQMSAHAAQMSAQFLTFTETFQRNDRNSEYRERPQFERKDGDSRGRDRERNYFGSRDRDRSPFRGYGGRDRSPHGQRGSDSPWRRRSPSPGAERPYQNRSRSRSPGYRTPSTKCSYCTGDPHWKIECPHASRTEKDRIVKAIKRQKMFEQKSQDEVDQWEKEFRQKHSCPPFPDDKNQTEKHDMTQPVGGEGPLTCYFCRKRGDHMDLTCPNFCVLCEEKGHGWTQCEKHKDKRIARFKDQQEAIKHWKGRGQKL